MSAALYVEMQSLSNIKLRLYVLNITAASLFKKKKKKKRKKKIDIYIYI